MTGAGVLKRVLAHPKLSIAWEMSHRLPTHAQVYMNHICVLASRSDTPGIVAFDAGEYGGATLAARLAWGARRFGREEEAQDALDALRDCGFITVEADGTVTLPVLVQAHAAAAGARAAAGTGPFDATTSRRENGKRGGRPRKGESPEQYKARKEAEADAARRQTNFRLVQAGEGRAAAGTEPGGLDVHGMLRSTFAVVPADPAESQAAAPVTASPEPGAPSPLEAPASSLQGGNRETGRKPKPETGEAEPGFALVSPVSGAAAAVVQQESTGISKDSSAAAANSAREAPAPVETGVNLNRKPKPKPEPGVQAHPVVLFPNGVPAPSDLNRLVEYACKRFGWRGDRRAEARVVFKEILAGYSPCQLLAELEAVRRAHSPRYFLSGQMAKRYGPPRSLELPSGLHRPPPTSAATLDPRVSEYPPWQGLPLETLSWCNRALLALDLPDAAERASRLTLIRDQSRRGDIRRSNDGEVWRLLLERFPLLEQEREPAPPGERASS